MRVTLAALAIRGVGRFFHWWGGELLSCLPLRLRHALGRRRRRLVIEVSEGVAILLLSKGDTLRPIGEVPVSWGKGVGGQDDDPRKAVRRILDGAGLRAAEVVLRLDRDSFLRRQIDLPAAAAENLREVLGFEMDRQTPFEVDEVYFDYRIADRDPQGNRIQVELVVVPRTVADEMTTMFKIWDLELDRIEVPVGPEEDARSFNLLPAAPGDRVSAFPKRLSLLLAAGACALLAFALYLPLQQKSDLLVKAEATLAEVRLAAAKVEALNERAEDIRERNRFVLTKKRSLRTATEILDEISRLLPDHTWVLKFALRGDRLTLSGYSGKPSALIGLLEQSEALSEVRFSSPVTLDQRIGVERFNISASVTPRSGT